MAANAAGLADRRHERRDVGGRTLVDVGRPDVERHRRHLERRARRSAGRCRRAPAILVVDDHAVWNDSMISPMLVDSGAAVDQRDAVEEERRGETAEHEVLDAGLLAGRRRSDRTPPARRAPATVSRGRGTARSGRWPTAMTTAPVAATRNSDVDLGAVVAGACSSSAVTQRDEQRGHADRDGQVLGEACRRRAHRLTQRDRAVVVDAFATGSNPLAAPGEHGGQRTRRRGCAATSVSAPPSDQEEHGAARQRDDRADGGPLDLGSTTGSTCASITPSRLLVRLVAVVVVALVVVTFVLDHDGRTVELAGRLDGEAATARHGVDQRRRRPARCGRASAWGTRR